jgi:lipoprotein-anchoring transpeptidase ErfK/SrfK
MTETYRFSRRDFLKLSASALGGALFSTLNLPAVEAAVSPSMLGRVCWNKVTLYDAPDLGGEKLGFHKFDEILQIEKTVLNADRSMYNRTWYKLQEGGYVYSGGIQPVQDILNTPVTDIPKQGGLLAELTVPFTDSHWKPTKNSRRGYRLYYGTTYWVRAIFEDEKGDPWYRIYDDLMKLVFFIRAEHLRIVPPEELIPVSPDLPEAEKTVIVSLPEQLMAAFEGERTVFSAKISSGVGKGNSHYASTPTGDFTTFFKRPAGHMVGGSAGAAYDLPGVPWTSYINNSGVSFHGTYWHNDFGKPRSHGCINLPNDKAKWVYRWTTPPVPDGKRHIYQPGTGTRVYIFDVPVFSPSSSPIRYRLDYDPRLDSKER